MLAKRMFLCLLLVHLGFCQWKMGPPMDYSRFGVAGCSDDNGMVYAIGGFYGEKLNICEVYSPENNSWSFCSDMITSGYYLACSCAAQQIILRGDTFSGRIQQYSPATNTWSDPVSESNNHNEVTAASYKDISYSIGGGISYGNGLNAYNVTKGTSEWLAAMPVGRRGMGAATINGAIYVAGGRKASGISGITGTLEKYEIETNRWRPLTPMPTARGNLGVVTLNGLLYAIGGITGYNEVLSVVEVFDPATNMWNSTFPLNVPRAGFGAAVSGNSIYVFGGYDNNEEYLNSMEVFTPTLE